MEAAVQTKQDVLARLRKHQAKLREFGVSRLGLFGSFRRETQTADSDVDFMVGFAPQKKTFRNYMALSFFLEDLLQRPVELLTEESLSPHIGDHIIEDVEYVSLPGLLQGTMRARFAARCARRTNPRRVGYSERARGSCRTCHGLSARFQPLDG